MGSGHASETSETASMSSAVKYPAGRNTDFRDEMACIEMPDSCVMRVSATSEGEQDSDGNARTSQARADREGASDKRSNPVLVCVLQSGQGYEEGLFQMRSLQQYFVQRAVSIFAGITLLLCGSFNSKWIKMI